ncbi:MAG TPA: helix-turn-helix domain-containing protein [Devosiaceae bacterium]|jgi:DNA-binding HxlR family transcriptional regulator
MSKQIFKRAGDHLPETCRPGWETLYLLGDKWTGPVLGEISQAGRLRFSEIGKAIGISQRMLTLTLRRLERDGLVRREVHPVIPPRVEYELTERGDSLLGALRDFARWGFENFADIEESRRVFDAAESA